MWRHGEAIFAHLDRPWHAILQLNRRALPAHHDLLVQLLIDDLHRAVDLGIGRAELMRNQLYREVDATDEGRPLASPGIFG